MSAAIYHGKILKQTSLEEALSLCRSLREVCLPKAQEGIAKEVAASLAVKADLAVNGREAKDDDVVSSLMDAMDKINKAKSKVLGDGVRDVDWDYTFELALIPIRSDILVLHFMENDPGFESAMTELGFEDYYYQNQSDKPKDIPEDEWEQREKDWYDCGYLQYQAPSTLGFTFTVVNWNDLFSPTMDKDLIQAQFEKLDPEKRKKRVALQLAGEDLDPWIKKEKPPISQILAASKKFIEENQSRVELADNIWWDE